MPKNKTVSFDGSRQCYVCETLEAEALTFPIHPAGPAVCTKCATLTPLDVVKIKDKAQQRRAILVTGAPIVLDFLKTALPKLLAKRSSRKRR